MQYLKIRTSIISGLVRGVQSALSVFVDNVVESSLAISDICHHVRAEVRSLVRTPHWATIRIAPMSISQASQILDVDPHENLDKILSQRDKLFQQLSLSPFLQTKVNEAYKCLEKSKSKWYWRAGNVTGKGKIQIFK